MEDQSSAPKEEEPSAGMKEAGRTHPKRNVLKRTKEAPVIPAPPSLRVSEDIL
jgi:hypothetical protein